MSLHGYADQCQVLAEELAGSIDESTLEALRTTLVDMGLRAWMDFRANNASEISAFLSASPSQRSRRKTWARRWPFLVLAAWQMSQEAQCLLRAVQHLEQGSSYRAMAADAAGAYKRIQDDPPEDWPWDEPDPFDPMLESA